MPALSTPADIEALADELSTAADTIHQRIIQDIERRKGAELPETDQAAIRVLLDDEMVLRQRANALYAAAAAVTVKTLAQPQAQVVKLTQDAAAKVRNIVRLSDALTVTGALAVVAGAVATGNPVAIVTALDKLRRTVMAAEAHG
jgi:hypothetical protein